MKIPVGLIIALATLAAIAGLAGVAWWWWDANWTELKEGSQAVMDEGQRDGAKLSESGCVDKAVARHQQSENRTFARSVHTSLYLRTCLDASQPEPKFCEGVPKKDDTIAYALWTSQRCTSLGFSDYYCSHVLGQVPEYCASGKRAPKPS